MIDSRARWLIYQCNVCKMKVARQLEDQIGDDVITGDAVTDILLQENHIPMIRFGIGKCSCCSIFRPSYTLIAHCKEENLPLEIYKDTIKIKINIPEGDMKSHASSKMCN